MKNHTMYLICEDTAVSTPQIIKSTDQSISIKAILQTAEEWNRNKRKYTKKLINDGLLRENVIEQMNYANGWCGEAGHPHKPDMQRQVTIDPKLISHRILQTSWNNNDLMGIVESLNTTYGRDFRNLIEQNMKVAFSLRAIAPFEQTSQGTIVGDPATLITYDWVILPSHKKAYQLEILNLTESLNESLSYLGNSLITESVIQIPIQATYIEATEYIKEQSKRIIMASEQLEFNKNKIYLSEKLNKVILSNDDNNDKLVINLESHIANEITSYYNKRR